MKTFLLNVTLFCISIINSYGQEKPIYNLRPPIRFIPIDSTSIVQPGQKIKLDFKTKEQNIGYYPPAFPSLRGAKRVKDDRHWYGDTVDIAIDGQKIEFIERKGKTVDYYLFDVECLLSRNYKQGQSLVIPYSTILETKADSILF